MTGLNVLHPFSRRNFLARCSGSAACAAWAGLSSAVASAPAMDVAALIPSAKARIRLVFTHPDPERQGWPYQGYDYEGRKAMLLSKLRRGCPNVEFLPATAKTAEDAKDVLKRDEEVDGYLLYMLGIPCNANEIIAYSKRPTIMVDDLYGGSGRFLTVYPRALQKEMPVAGVSSTRFADLVEAVKAFECIKKLRASTLLDVTERDYSASVDLYKQALGLTIRQVKAAELSAAYEKADPAEARKWARTWIDNAERVIEPTAAEIQKSGAMYIGMRDLLAQHKAQGITVDCLQLMYHGNLIPAYPCLGFFQFNNDGLVGACEADLQSATTMLLLTYLVGRPGYISDPVIDTSKNQVIYAHCVASNKVFGPKGPSNPYHIRDHTEDHKGAAVRSLMPLGEMTTSLKLIPQQKTVVMHQAKTVANIDEDRACRTKLAADVKDARKLMAGWDYGWHRVTVFGDVKLPVETVSRLLGFKVVEEG